MNRQPFRDSDTRRNYFLLLAEGILFTLGQVFFDANTVLPLLMERLTGSVILVGVVGAIQPLAKGFVPVLAGNWITSLEYKRGFLLAVIALGRLPLWILGAGLVLLPHNSPALWAVVLLSIQLLFWFGDSAGDPAWMDLVGKSVSVRRRGRFFAIRQVIGGALAAAAGTVVARVLESPALAFPVNYGVVICIGALIYTGNVATFIGVRERPSQTGERLPIATLLRRLPHYIRRNPTFARTISVSILVNLSRIALPFFIVFGRRVFGLSEAAFALILPLQMAGRMTGAAVWGYLGDRFGHHIGIRGVSAAFALPSIVAFILAVANPATVSAAAFSLLFFVLGFALEGFPPFINYMLETVPEHERPLYAGLLTVGFVPAAFAPILGGVVIGGLGFSWLFLLAALFAAGAMLLAFRLPPVHREAEGERKR